MGCEGDDRLGAGRLSPDDLDGKFLAVIATNIYECERMIYREAQRRGVLCNVVDVPEVL